MNIQYPNVQRRYVESSFGQSHVYLCKPKSPTNKLPLVCFHMGPWSAATLEPLLAQMGADRLAVGVDTPGFGNSDPTPNQPTMADYAKSMGDVADQLGLERFDVLGDRTGAKIALELARQRPIQVGRLILISPVIWDGDQARNRSEATPQPIDADGSHLAKHWQVANEVSMTGRTPDMIARVFPSRLQQYSISHWGATAAAQYDARGTLESMDKPIMVLRPKDNLWDLVDRVRPYLMHQESKIVDLPEWSFGFLDLKAQETAQLVREFLDAQAR